MQCTGTSLQALRFPWHLIWYSLISGGNWPLPFLTRELITTLLIRSQNSDCSCMAKQLRSFPDSMEIQNLGLVHSGKDYGSTFIIQRHIAISICGKVVFSHQLPCRTQCSTKSSAPSNLAFVLMRHLCKSSRSSLWQPTNHSLIRNTLLIECFLFCL